MPGLIQRVFAPPPERGANRKTRVLAVTADLRFYSGVLNAATSAHWRADWACTFTRAVEICRSKSPPIVIYDSSLPGVEWSWAFEQLGTVPGHPRILLAAASIDEDLWRDVLGRHGYDVVERSASSEELRRIFRFAWLSFLTLAD